MGPRVAVIGLGSENATFSPLPTTLADFNVSLPPNMEKGYAPVLQDAAGKPLDLKGTVLEKGFEDITFCYVCRYRALPGGPIEPAAFEVMKATMVENLTRVLPVDGVWLDFHGAMYVTGEEDCEGGLAQLVRGIVGSKPLISASFDLHGNFSKRLAEAVDMTAAYRTAPHVDVLETRRKAVSMLVTSLRRPEAPRPRVSYVAVPLAVSGEMSNTADEPSKTLYTTVLEEADRRDGVLDASILIGYCWADEPRTGASVLVSGCDYRVNDEEALRIAKAVWDARTEFRFGVESAPPLQAAQQALEKALEAESQGGLVTISDSGDNPTAGGVGDESAMLEVMMEVGKRTAASRKVSVVVQGPVDPEAVKMCEGGGSVTLRVGKGKTMLEGSVRNVFPEREYRVNVMAGTGKEHWMTLTAPPAAVVEVQAGCLSLSVILSARRFPLLHVADFDALRVDLLANDVLVLKIGYLVPDILQHTRYNIMALSPGAVYADLTTLSYKHAPPFFPRCPTLEWSPSLTQPSETPTP
eukprot:Sspe_Gene.49369::Locus_26553_Transcript_1_1_Confidence_1.000_Length_1679::g.49369::m.49369